MRILIVAEDLPWPSTGGGLIRLAKVIEAVSDPGDTDLFTLYEPGRTDLVLPPTVSVERLATASWRAAWLAQRGLPMVAIMRKFDRSPRLAFDAWVGDNYDFVWFSTAATFTWMGRPGLGPTIIDLMDLEDEKARQRAALMREQRPGGSMAASLRLTIAGAQASKNARDWQTFQRSGSPEAERVVLCKEASGMRPISTRWIGWSGTSHHGSGKRSPVPRSAWSANPHGE